MQDVAKMFGQKETGKFSQLFDLASTIANTCQNPKEELSKYGINADTIRKAKSIINLPGVGWIISKYGDKNKIIEDLDKLENLFGTENKQSNLLTEQAPVNELELMRQNLARLK